MEMASEWGEQLSLDHIGMHEVGGAQGETSAEAAEWIEADSGRLRLVVLWAIRNAPNGLTDEEGIEITGMAANTWRPRRVELCIGWQDFTGGYVEDRGIRRKTKSGRNAIAWLATEKGMRA